MKLTNTNWAVVCKDVEQKAELIAYAKAKGIGCQYSAGRDSELAIGWNDFTENIYSFSLDWVGTPNCIDTSIADFRRMCQKHAASQKLPRRIKKRLKLTLLKRIDPRWKASEVKITGWAMNWRTRKLVVTGYKLGY